MVTEAFNIRGSQRLTELQDYLKSNMPTATCAQSAARCSETDLIEVTIRYNFADMEKMEQLQDNWRKQDRVVAQQQKRGVLQRFYI